VTSVWARVRTGLRERARSWIALALIIGVFGGIVIAAAAGARRTDNAYPRFLSSQRAYQQFLFTFPLYPGTAEVSAEQLRSLPEVEHVVEGVIFDGLPEIVLRGSIDPRLDRSLNGVHLLEGRLPTETDDILIPPLLAEQRHLKVGDPFAFTLRAEEGAGPQINGRVVGIGISPGEFPPVNDIGIQYWAHVSPAFVKTYGQNGAPFAYVFLRNGDDDLDAFQAGLNRLAGGKPVIGYQQASLTKNVRRAFRLQAVSLWLLALLLGVTVLALVAQTISRVTWMETQDHPILSAVGMTRSQLFSASVLRVALVAIGSALIATALAFALSPLAPTGRARSSVLDAGFKFDGLVLGIGALAVIGACVVLALIPGWRASRTLARLGPEVGTGRSIIAEAALRGGAPATTGIGLRFALERGRGRTAVPTRATIVGATLAVTAIAMTLSFGGSLQHLLKTPRLYGATFDLIGSSTEDSGVLRAQVPATIAAVRSVPEVLAVAEGGLGIPLRMNGELADAVALDADEPSLLPPLLQGRYPSANDEVALGANTLKAIKGRVGGTVEVSALGTTGRPFTIVGTAVIPTVGHSGNLGEGSLVSNAAARAIFSDDGSTMGDLVIKLRPGADVNAAGDAIRRATDGAIGELEVPMKPGDLVNFGGQRNLPFVLAAILALMAIVTIGHALVSSINRRRRDIAILKASGFTPRQARLTIAWQASTLMVLGLAFGLPLGIIAGRALWTTYAHTLGIIAEPRPPFSLLMLIAPAAILLCNVVALLPATRAAHVQPAIVLRTE
jgi:hypothetical protein